MHPALRKGLLFNKKHPHFPLFYKETLPTFHFLTTGLAYKWLAPFATDV